MIAVVDYHKGNLMSVERGIEAAGGEALITDDAGVIARADGIVLPGVVCRMPRVDAEGNAYKIPHVGWNTVAFAEDCPLFDGIPSGEYFYFTHSYIAPTGPFVVGETAHSVAFPSAVQYGERCFGVQFHPEKSSDAGAAVLRNFVRIVEGA